MFFLLNINCIIKAQGIAGTRRLSPHFPTSRGIKPYRCRIKTISTADAFGFIYGMLSSLVYKKFYCCAFYTRALPVQEPHSELSGA